MRADTHHTPTAEDIMAFLDGEGSPAERTAIQSHLAACSACQAIAKEQRGLSGTLAAWRVDAAPATLRPRQEPMERVPRPWRPSRAAVVGLGLAASLAVVVMFPIVLRTRSSPPVRAAAGQQAVAIDRIEAALPDSRISGNRSPAPAGPGGAGGRVLAGKAQVSAAPPNVAGNVAAISEAAAQTRTAAVIRTASLALIAKDFAAARAAVEALLPRVGGFADHLSVTEDAGSAHVLRGTLRVPGDRLADTLVQLRALGHVTQDQQGAQDVADQLIDLDARLASSRATEQRLIDLLKNRTGRLSDVLDVERELTRVRLDIERLAAEKENLGRRVSYATIDLSIAEARKAGLEAGPLPLTTRIRVAAANGVEAAFETVIAAMLFVLSAGPTLALWGVTALIVWSVFRRLAPRASLIAHRPSPPTASE